MKISDLVTTIEWKRMSKSNAGGLCEHTTPLIDASSSTSSRCQKPATKWVITITIISLMDNNRTRTTKIQRICCSQHQWIAIPGELYDEFLAVSTVVDKADSETQTLDTSKEVVIGDDEPTTVVQLPEPPKKRELNVLRHIVEPRISGQCEYIVARGHSTGSRCISNGFQYIATTTDLKEVRHTYCYQHRNTLLPEEAGTCDVLTHQGAKCDHTARLASNGQYYCAIHRPKEFRNWEQDVIQKKKTEIKTRQEASLVPA
jgi:hypothetical protein